MSDDTPTAADVLCRENEHCQRLLEAVRGPGPIKADELGYEDVFYPLRHHHRDGLVLELTVGSIDDKCFLRWGPGDFIYRRWEFETKEARIDPFKVWQGIQNGALDPLVTIDEDHREVSDP